ncbi:MAG: hypothetical protein AABY93_05735 [Bacteroidota bacterium]
MKKIISLALILMSTIIVFGQTDKDQLALKVAKAEEQNLTKLKEYIWKRRSNVFMDNQLKLTTITEFKFNKEGKIEATVIDANTTVKKKPGLRGAAQKSAAEDKLDYIQKALELSISYAFLSKGELVDFFDKATITEKDGMLEAVANNVLVQGDKLLVKIDPAINLITYREFTSLLGKDAIDGKLNYDKFSNGTLHGTMTTLNMPVQKMRIEGSNQDYTIRVN